MSHSLLSKFWKNYRLPVLCMALFIIVLLSLPWWRQLQQSCDQRMMRHHTENRFEHPVYIVYFDDADLSALGGWPLKRNIYGYVAEQLKALGVRTIGFHVFWEENHSDNDENDAFLASVLSSQPGFVGSLLIENSSNKNHASSVQIQWPDSTFIKTGIPFGFTNLVQSQQGMVLKTPVRMQAGDRFFRSFALEVAQDYLGKPIAVPGTVTIHYSVDREHLPLIPVRSLLDPEMSDSLRSVLNDGIVILGILSSQLGLEKPTPVDPAMPVLGIHAEIVDNLLSQSYLSVSPLWILCLCLFVPIVILSVKKNPSLIFVCVFLICCGMCLTGIYFLQWQMDRLFPVLAGMVWCAATAIVYLSDHLLRGQRLILEEIEKRQMMETQFSERVKAAAQLEREYLALRDKYQKEIKDLRVTLSNVSDTEAELVRNEYPEIICEDQSPMVAILTEIKRIGFTEEPVLISGESGTGKELVARAIHQKSKRAIHPFIAVNCGAITESLLESELFGYEKGAFTGAQKTKQGFFESADKGTIFLDEISETSLAFQSRLLRILQEGTYFRVGSTQLRHVDVRIIAATNQQMDTLIGSGRFRQDLFFRLNVLPVNLPPLRERSDDIPMLMHHFLGGRALKLSEGAERLMKAYPWPGNIRELQNIVARMKILPEDTLITSDWLQQQLVFDMSHMPTSESIDEKILALYRHLEFRNNANTLIAESIGHLHRSTITEYLKGMTFQFFYEENFKMDEAVRRFNPNPDNESDRRLKSRMLKYLQNLVDKLDSRNSIENNLHGLSDQLRKVPRKYHTFALETARAYLMKQWTL